MLSNYDVPIQSTSVFDSSPSGNRIGPNCPRICSSPNSNDVIVVVPIANAAIQSVVENLVPIFVAIFIDYFPTCRTIILF